MPADINVGQITEALNDKTDRDLQNINTVAGADAVVEYQMPTAENGYTWYRKYKSGWVEQGGFLPKTSGDVQNTVVLPVEMASSVYNITKTATDETVSGGVTWFCYTITNQTTTGFKTYTGTNWAVYWKVEGMAAQ